MLRTRLKTLEYRKSKGKAITIQVCTGLRSPGEWDSQISWKSAHKRGKIFRPKHRPPLFPRKYSWYLLLLEAKSTPGHSAAERITSMKNSNVTIRNRTRDLPFCSALLWKHGQFHIFENNPPIPKIPFMKKLRTLWSQRMLAIIQCRIFCLPICNPIKKYRTIILPVFMYGMETWSHWGRNVGWEGSRIECWGRYLGLRRLRWERNAKDYIHNEEFYALCLSFRWWNKKRMRRVGHVVRRWDRRGADMETWGKENTCRA